MLEESEIVSVCMVTYKHESFIAEAIEGVLMQQVNFRINLIIGDDSSPDKTSLIVNEIIEKHSKGHWITYIKRAENIGMMSNFIDLLKRCKGTYIALCDGDDYWTDPFKLQKQVDFLEKNNEVVLTNHPVLLKNNQSIDNDFLGSKFDHLDQITSIYDLAIFGNYIRTCSVVFRNINYNYMEGLDKSGVGDYFLYMKLTEHGSIFKFNEVMSVYRNNVGIHSTSSSKAKRKSWIKTINVLIQSVENKKVKEILKDRIGEKNSIRLVFENFGLELISKHLSIKDLLRIVFLKLNRRINLIKK
jgi:glycosyltransferase involved in cell wall biosynthesis